MEMDMETALQSFYHAIEDREDLLNYFNDASYIVIDGVMKAVGKEKCTDALIELFEEGTPYVEEVGIFHNKALGHGYVYTGKGKKKMFSFTFEFHWHPKPNDGFVMSYLMHQRIGEPVNQPQ